MTVPPITEKAFQAQIVQFGKLTGWWVYHTFDSRKSQAGFPDLTIIRDHHPIIFWECKTEKGRVSKAQEKWLAVLDSGPNEARIVRPSDWAYIEERLTRGRGRG